jgi:mannose-6-phosphate isomerase-like protein (cupin superfamily)
MSSTTIHAMPTFQQYESAALARGFDEVAERRWESAAEAPLHTHPFSVEALVVQGEMWLTVDEDTRHLRPGDTFELDLGQQHSERYGAEGATYWAARRTGRNR